MQYEDKEIRRLAKLYWEGKIPLKDESILFTFISDDANRKKYVQWEEEWKSLTEKEPDVEREWQLIQNRMRARENTTVRVLRTTVPVWKKITAVAAIALLLVTTALGVHDWTIRNNKEVYTIDVPMGEKSKLYLPDGSTVWINAGSRIQYTSLFNIRDREVALNGEAYFEVKKQNDKPFIVKLNDYNIEVKGTKFNVLSYENEKYAVTTLMEGSISLRYDGREYEMKPGEMIQIDVQEKKLRLQRTNTTQYRSWTEDRIEFDEITLSELFKHLSRRYNVQIHIDPDIDTHTLLFSVSFNNRETIDEIFYGISKVISIQYKHEHNHIYVLKK
ncbi:MAG: FecR domain-containing protein [Tannerella sp.]|jgi:ferric-dicitrate binding protein FerR (iron transport regulator)|nr:FecR domain-containing protein [Tannerella sp.]